MPASNEVAAQKCVAVGGSVGENADQDQAVDTGNDGRGEVEFLQGCVETREFAEEEKEEARDETGDVGAGSRLQDALGKTPCFGIVPISNFTETFGSRLVAETTDSAVGGNVFTSTFLRIDEIAIRAVFKYHWRSNCSMY